MRLCLNQRTKCMKMRELSIVFFHFFLILPGTGVVVIGATRAAESIGFAGAAGVASAVASLVCAIEKNLLHL